MSDRTPALTAVEFKTYLPVFGNSMEFPDATIEVWLQKGSNQCDPLVWKDLWVSGVMFYTAHFLTLLQRLGAPNSKGIAGLELSKTVGKVSVDYDTTATSMKDGGPFNTTTYGTQFLFYARMVGAGPLQITGPLYSPPGIPLVVVPG